MITVRDIEDIKKQLLDIFPDAVRGGKRQTIHRNGKRKVLHLSYWIGSDTIGGEYIEGKGSLLYFVAWDSNTGDTYKFAESSVGDMVERVRLMNEDGVVSRIERTVCF